MIDPQIIGPAISGIVSLITSFMSYRLGIKKAKDGGAGEPPKPDPTALQKGEQAYEIVKAGVTQHGDADDQADLANFERNPQRYADTLNRTVTSLAQRVPAFADQLQTLAQQANIQTGGVRISGGNIIGNVLDTNTGTINSTYTINDRNEQ